MTAHRRSYMDLHEPARDSAPEQVDGFSIGSYIVGGLAVFILSVAGLASLVRATLQHPDGATGQRVTLPHPQAIEEARIQGFRAGFATASEQGCQPALSHPLGQ